MAATTGNKQGNGATNTINNQGKRWPPPRASSMEPCAIKTKRLLIQTPMQTIMCVCSAVPAHYPSMCLHISIMYNISLYNISSISYMKKTESNKTDQEKHKKGMNDEENHAIVNWEGGSDQKQ